MVLRSNSGRRCYYVCIPTACVVVIGEARIDISPLLFDMDAGNTRVLSTFLERGSILSRPETISSFRPGESLRRTSLLYDGLFWRILVMSEVSTTKNC